MLVSVASVLAEDTVWVDWTAVDDDPLETVSAPSDLVVEAEIRSGREELAFSFRVVLGTGGRELTHLLVCDLA